MRKSLALTAAVMLTGVLVPGVAQAAAPAPCLAGSEKYVASTVLGQKLAVVDYQANYNGTPHNATSTFHAQKSGTIGQSVTAEVSFKAGTVLAGAEAKTGLNLSMSLTASIGNTFSVATPSRKTTHAQYGVFRMRTKGSYVVVSGQCSPRYYPMEAASPLRVGWYAWQS